MFLLVIFAWLLLGYFGGLVFSKKGYPPKLGFVVGMFLGPIALAVCFLLPTTQQGREQAALEVEIELERAKNQGSKRCPQCDRELGRTARICPRCDHRFEPTPM